MSALCAFTSSHAGHLPSHLPLSSLAQVTDFDISDGVLRVQCAEAVVGRIDLHFIDPKTQLPVEKPKTRTEVGYKIGGEAEFGLKEILLCCFYDDRKSKNLPLQPSCQVITRHLVTKPGRVYNLNQAKRDIASVYSTGLFEDVNISPKEAEDSTETSPKVRGGCEGEG